MSNHGSPLTEVPSPESLDAEGLRSVKSAVPTAGL